MALFSDTDGPVNPAVDPGYDEGFKAGALQGGQFFAQPSQKYGQQAQGYFQTALAPFFEPAKSSADYYMSAAQNVQRDLFDLLGQGYEGARGNVAAQQRAGTQGILDAQTQAFGQSQQAAIDAGLSGSTAQSSANRSIASDTSRALSNLSAQIGQLYSSLDIGQAQAQGGALSGLSNLFQNQAGQELGFLQTAFSGLNQTPIEPKEQSAAGPILGGLLAGLGGFLG